MTQRQKIFDCIVRYTHYHIHFGIREKSANYTEMWNRVQRFAADMNDGRKAAIYLDAVYAEYIGTLRGILGKPEVFSLFLQGFVVDKLIKRLSEQGRIDLIGRGVSSAVHGYMRTIGKMSSTLFFAGGLDADRTIHEFSRVLECTMRIEGDKLIDPNTGMIPVGRYNVLLAKYRELQGEHAKLKHQYAKLKKKEKKEEKKLAAATPIEEFLSDISSVRS